MAALGSRFRRFWLLSMYFMPRQKLRFTHRLTFSSFPESSIGACHALGTLARCKVFPYGKDPSVFEKRPRGTRTLASSLGVRP
jgi:hypothetical protein